MEKWEEVFVGQIEKDQYLLECLSGESKGLQLILEGIKKKNRILVDFGAVSAYRLIDEGILCWTHFDELAAEKFAKDHFQNVIYQVENGEFSSFIKKIADELFCAYELKHYILFTLNYVVEIETTWEPEISYLLADNQLSLG